MLQWIVNALEAFFDIFRSLVAFIVSLVQSVFDMIKLLPTVVSLFVSSIGFLPSMLSLFATLSITVSIIYLIVGRNNN